MAENKKLSAMFHAIAHCRDEAQRMTGIIEGGESAIGQYAQGGSGDVVEAQVDELIIAEYALLSAKRVMDKIANSMNEQVSTLYNMMYQNDAAVENENAGEEPALQLVTDEGQ